MKYPHNPMWDVDEDEFQKFWEEVIELAHQRFGLDDDGDCPVNVYLVNRSTQEAMNFVPLLSHRILSCATRDVWNRTMDEALMNLSIAKEQLERIWRLMMLRYKL